MTLAEAIGAEIARDLDRLNSASSVLHSRPDDYVIRQFDVRSAGLNRVLKKYSTKSSVALCEELMSTSNMGSCHQFVG